jgi:hypothetical protein
MIELPSRGERDYLAQFGVTAVYVTSSGKLGVGRDLARGGAIAAWWARDIATAEAVLVAIGAACPVTIEQATAEVQAAAGRLGVTLSSHDVVMERAKAAVAKLDAKLAATQSAGLLSAFNREFKERRLRANAAGARFMTYAAARRRLA